MPRDFVVKLPRQDNENYKKHVKELLQESQILSSVDHPNIIKIHGHSSMNASQSDSNRFTMPFFLILDRLSYTLEDLLNVWVCKNNSMNKLKYDSCKNVFFRQRLQIACT